MISLSQAALDHALIAELCSGRKFMEERQHLREIEAAKEARQYKGAKAKTALGKHLLSVPQHEWFIMREKYGAECWEDRGFIKDFQRLNPDLASNKA